MGNGRMTETEINKLTGVGRDDLLRRIRELEKDRDAWKLAADGAGMSAAVLHERDKYREATLTAAQARSTECLNIARAVKAIGDDPVMQSLAPLGAAIVRARAKHPVGSTLRHLVSEVGELADAMCIGDEGIGGDIEKREQRIRDGALDVAVVAMRIVFGETRP